MSNPLRPPVVGHPPTMSGTFMAPMCNTGIPSAPMIPVVPSAYGLIGSQPTSYIQHPGFPQQNFSHQVPLINTTTRSMPGMFVPVTPMNASLSRPNVDPAKLIEEQKKLEKERNFQMQQQRLKQFTVAGKTGSLNADNLIENIIGKVQPKSSSTSSNSSIKSCIYSEPVKPSKPKPVIETHPFPVTIVKQEIPVNPPKPKKELEAMMRECSDLSAPQKASKFTKPSVKELAPSIQQRYTFASSNKSRDWKNLVGLDEVFVTKRPRFPPWCSTEHVPELFKQIEAIVTSNGTTPPDTKLLFPILVSSGLPQQILGHIWELVNQSSPGQLITEEIYAALALIALAQAGHIITTVDILHQLPACPIPQLQCFAAPSPPLLPESQTVSTPPPQAATNESKFSAFTDSKLPADQNSHLVIRPSAISLKDVNSSAGVPNIFIDNKNEIVTNSVDSSGFISSPDDEFDDFKSATPTAVNFSINTPPSDSLQGNDDFADFKQAPPPLSSSMIFNKVPATSDSTKPPLEEQDLMSPEEDKYSVFRSLQQTESSDDWGAFSAVTTDFTSSAGAKQSVTEETSQNNNVAPPSGPLPNPSVLVTNTDANIGLFTTNIPILANETKDEDDFGDFLTAEPSVPNVEAVTTQLESLNTNFADFSNFKESPCSSEFHQVPSAAPTNHSQLDEDFGDFASSLPIPCKPEMGSEFLFRHLKDNISLTESQSVSSLELGPFDGGGHSGESKSSLSRQGSIPSLDLKSAYPEGADNEDCFGDFQSPIPVSVTSKTPSPAKDTKVQENGNSTTNSLNSNFQNSRNLPLMDKYSVIRAEERKDEDQHISCWVRCLQSSVNLLQNTKKLFNQMSCSAVCNEVLQSEEGENYIKDVIEVYKVVRRIAVASKSAGKQTQPIIDLLDEADQTWQTVCGYIAGSSLMPKESSFEFSRAILDSNSEDSNKACGLCLLNIEIKSKLCNEDSLNLSYGGRNYHSTCANLWVNCVDPLLPALPLPQLL